MDNFIKNKNGNNPALNKALREERKKWLKQMQEIVAKQASLGHGKTSIEEFKSIKPDVTTPTHLLNEIISLQQDIEVLLAERSILGSEEEWVVDEFNQKHAVIHIDQTYILTEKPNVFGNPDFGLESKQSFKNFYEDEMVFDHRGYPRPKTEIWLKSPQKRKYIGITFDPINREEVSNYYNIWKGFTKKPAEGDCSLYWDHIKQIVCSNNCEIYAYVRKWLAYIFQHPDKVHTALVLCGSQGVGKNSFVEPLGILLGQHYVLLSSIAELVSNFNYHLKNAVLIHANEALWGGNKKELGTVKAMITEQTCLIEGKGKDRIMVKNYKHLILSSNEDWPVHLDRDDRRFLVLRVSEARKEDHVYFAALQDQLNKGGYEALLYDLLNEDTKTFNPRNLPQSSDAFEIKIRSADSDERYIYQVLLEGHFCLGQEELGLWQTAIPKADVYKHYSEWALNSGEKPVNNSVFGTTLKKLIPSIKNYRSKEDNQRIRQYKLPSIEQARGEFAKAYKEQASRIFEETEN